MMHKLSERFAWASKRVHGWVVASRKTILGLGGLGCIDASVWINSTTWGLVATGVTLLLLQYLAEGSNR